MNDNTAAQHPTPELSNLQHNRTPPMWFSKRLLVAILQFLAYFFFAMTGLVLNIAIVDMTSNKTYIIGNETVIEAPEFDWDLKTIGLISNMYWYGNLFSYFGGYVSQKFGSSLTKGVSMMLIGTVMILQPIIARSNFYLFLGTQLSSGILWSSFMASNASTFAQWIPKRERSTLMSYIMSGMSIGFAVTYPFCGYIMNKWGWPIPFYITGTSIFSWSIIWLTLVGKSPSKDKWISNEERAYILKETNTSTKKISTQPFKEIFKSAPVWAIFSNRLVASWVSVFVTGYLPLYMKDVTQQNIDEIGILSGIPSFINIFSVPIAGMLLDCWQRRSHLSLSQIHKLIIFVDFIIMGVLFVVLAFARNLFLVIFSLSMITFALTHSRIITEMISVNMAPNHASLLSSLIMFWYTSGSILVQNVIGFVVKSHGLQEWGVCFALTTGVVTLGAVAFVLLGSSEPQPWSVVKIIDKTKTEEEENKELPNYFFFTA